MPGWMWYGGFDMPYQYQKPDPDMERQALKSQADALQSELEFVKKRLSEIESEITEK